MKNKFPAWLVLMVICVVAAMLLAATNLATKDVIAENARREAMATLGKLMPDAADFESLESGITVGKDADGHVVGYATTALTQGFGGEIETTVASKPDGTLGGISVGGANFAETAGLGARAKEPEFQEQFAGKTVPVALTKDGGEIEALSGATITSRAVIKGVNQAAEAIGAEAGFEVASTNNAEHVGENKYAASVPGYGGPVKVFLTLDENRAITEISIGDSQFAESPGMGALALEADFQDQFIGKTIPLTMGDIDAISGATITSTAVVDAINMIHEGLDSGLADAPITDTVEETPGAEPKAEVNSHGDGKYDAAAQGFGGPVRVFLTLDENNTITAIEIGDNEFNETEYLGERALEPEFQQQFIGKTLPVSMDDIDALSGATVTTNAVLNAISQIGESLGVNTSGTGEAAEAVPKAEVNSHGDGKYDAAAQGFGGPVRVFLTLDENNTITAIEIGDNEFNETEYLGERALEPEFQQQFIGKTLPVNLDDIDALTGATVTTNAVLNAINQIAEAAGAGSAAAPETSEPAEEQPAEAPLPSFGDDVVFKPGTYTGTGKGWSDHQMITVRVTVDAGGITAAEIEGAEEIPFGTAQFEQYAAALIGRRDGNIDAVTNATETRNGIREAVWNALEQAVMDENVQLVPGTYEGTGKGWSDDTPVTVKLTVDENGITSAEIEGAGEVPFGVEQFTHYASELIGRRNGNIDAVTNATETRNGIREAVWMAIEQAIAK